MLESALGLAGATVGAAGQTRSTTLGLSLGLMSWMLNRSARYRELTRKNRPEDSLSGASSQP
jgi:hypothetical protein